MVLPRFPLILPWIRRPGSLKRKLLRQPQTPGNSAPCRLKLHPFLEGISPHHQKILCDCSQPAHFEPGEVICREGDPADRFYLIEKGRVVLETYVKGKGIVALQILGPGDVLGWSWLFAPNFWHFSAHAVEPTDMSFIPATPLRDECEADHDLGFELVKRLAAIMLKQLQASRRTILEPPDLPKAKDKSYENALYFS